MNQGSYAVDLFGFKSRKITEVYDLRGIYFMKAADNTSIQAAKIIKQ